MVHQRTKACLLAICDKHSHCSRRRCILWCTGCSRMCARKLSTSRPGLLRCIGGSHGRQQCSPQVLQRSLPSSSAASWSIVPPLRPMAHPVPTSTPAVIPYAVQCYVMQNCRRPVSYARSLSAPLFGLRGRWPTWARAAAQCSPPLTSFGTDGAGPATATAGTPHYCSHNHAPTHTHTHEEAMTRAMAASSPAAHALLPHPALHAVRTA